MENNFILCIETCTEVCSVALSNAGICIAEKSINEPNSHGTELTVLIENLLKENKLMFSKLTAVAYSSGPGSYTGLRIGLSVAKGICYGANIPLIEISTLQHIAYAVSKNHPHLYYFPMLDARRLEVYGALLDANFKFIKNPFACIVDQYNWQEVLATQKVCFVGNGVAKSKPILSIFPNAVFVEDYIISASSICFLANDKFIKKEFANLAYSVPFYLKEANITVNKKKML